MRAACCKSGASTHSPVWFHWTQRRSALWHHPCSPYAVCSCSSIHSTSRCLRSSPETKGETVMFGSQPKNRIWLFTLRYIFRLKDPLQTCLKAYSMKILYCTLLWIIYPCLFLHKVNRLTIPNPSPSLINPESVNQIFLVCMFNCWTQNISYFTEKSILSVCDLHLRITVSKLFVMSQNLALMYMPQI